MRRSCAQSALLRSQNRHIAVSIGVQTDQAAAAKDHGQPHNGRQIIV